MTNCLESPKDSTCPITSTSVPTLNRPSTSRYFGLFAFFAFVNNTWEAELAEAGLDWLGLQSQGGFFFRGFGFDGGGSLMSMTVVFDVEVEASGFAFSTLLSCLSHWTHSSTAVPSSTGPNVRKGEVSDLTLLAHETIRAEENSPKYTFFFSYRMVPTTSPVTIVFRTGTDPSM